MRCTQARAVSDTPTAASAGHACMNFSISMPKVPSGLLPRLDGLPCGPKQAHTVVGHSLASVLHRTQCNKVGAMCCMRLQAFQCGTSSASLASFEVATCMGQSSCAQRWVSKGYMQRVPAQALWPKMEAARGAPPRRRPLPHALRQRARGTRMRRRTRAGWRACCPPGAAPCGSRARPA